MTLSDFRFVAIEKRTMSGTITISHIYKIECWRRWSFRAPTTDGAVLK